MSDDADRLHRGAWSDSPVLTVRTRVEAERGRWVLHLDVVRIPDHDDYVVTHRLGDYASHAEAMTIARFVERGANREMPHPPLGF